MVSVTAEPEYLMIRNWDKYQGYKAATPTWIKLYVALMDDPLFDALKDPGRAHMFGLFVLAAKTKNKMLNDAHWISKRIHATHTFDLDAFRGARFLVPWVGGDGVSDDSVTPSTIVEDSLRSSTILALDRDSDREGDRERERSQPLVRENADRAVIRDLHDHFNTKRGGRPLALTTERYAKYRARLKTFSVDDIKQAIDTALADPFYQGDNDRSRRFDFPETVLKNDAAVDRHLSRAHDNDPQVISVNREEREAARQEVADIMARAAQEKAAQRHAEWLARQQPATTEA